LRISAAPSGRAMRAMTSPSTTPSAASLSDRSDNYSRNIARSSNDVKGLRRLASTGARAARASHEAIGGHRIEDVKVVDVNGKGDAGTRIDTCVGVEACNCAWASRSSSGVAGRLARLGGSLWHHCARHLDVEELLIAKVLHHVRLALKCAGRIR